jgi:transposase
MYIRGKNQIMSIFQFKQTGRISFFDKEETSEKLSKLGNPLEKLHKVIDFEMFRTVLEATMLNPDRKSNAGPKPYDVVMMFKIILLKRFYNLSDEQAEYQINDRLSFKEFLGLSSGDRIPDSRTIWLFQDNLLQKNLETKLFHQFHKYLDDLGLFVNEGKIVDASFVEVPRQRNSKEENAQIKTGAGDELWQKEPKKKNQKDIEARWTEKGGQKYYGYKDHAKIDAKSKLIDTYEVTSTELGEHVFGFITNSINAFYINSIGLIRAKGTVGLINLLYNMCRYEQIVRLELLQIKKN